MRLTGFASLLAVFASLTGCAQTHTGNGWFVVLNGWTAPVVVQMRPPTAGGSAYRIDPHQHGPTISAFPFGTEVFIFTTDCQQLGVSRIEGGYRGTIIREDGSFEISDLGDLGTSQVEYADPCPLPPPSVGDST